MIEVAVAAVLLVTFRRLTRAVRQAVRIGCAALRLSAPRGVRPRPTLRQVVGQTYDEVTSTYGAVEVGPWRIPADPDEPVGRANRKGY